MDDPSPHHTLSTSGQSAASNKLLIAHFVISLIILLHSRTGTLIIVILVCVKIGKRCDMSEVHTTFLGQGPQCIICRALEGRRQNSELNYREPSIKKSKIYLTSLFV